MEIKKIVIAVFLLVSSCGINAMSDPWKKVAEVLDVAKDQAPIEMLDITNNVYQKTVLSRDNFKNNIAILQNVVLGLAGAVDNSLSEVEKLIHTAMPENPDDKDNWFEIGEEMSGSNKAFGRSISRDYIFQEEQE